MTLHWDSSDWSVKVSVEVSLVTGSVPELCTQTFLLVFSEGHLKNTCSAILKYFIPCILVSSNTFLITPTKYTIFIHYVYLLCFSYMLRCLTDCFSSVM